MPIKLLDMPSIFACSWPGTTNTWQLDCSHCKLTREPLTNLMPAKAKNVASIYAASLQGGGNTLHFSALTISFTHCRALSLSFCTTTQDNRSFSIHTKTHNLKAPYKTRTYIKKAISLSFYTTIQDNKSIHTVTHNLKAPQNTNIDICI